jgi:manganese transport protein
MFTASKAKMGELVAPKWLSAIAYVVAIVIAGLNVKLLFDFMTGG